MKHAQNITPILGSNRLDDQGSFEYPKAVSISKDRWLGECLDDYLFKLCGTDQVIWIPKDLLKPSQCDEHAFEALISSDEMYCCARMIISNSIRMCLVDQHLVRGCQLYPHLIES